MNLFTKNRLVTVAMSAATVIALYNYQPTRDQLFNRGWFG